MALDGNRGLHGGEGGKMGLYDVVICTSTEEKQEVYALDAKGIMRQFAARQKVVQRSATSHYCLFLSDCKVFCFVSPRCCSVLLSTTSRHRHQR